MISRIKLIEAMKLLINATSKNDDSLLGTDSFIFSKDYISTFNNRVSFSSQISTNIECTIKANETLSILEKMQSDEINLLIKDNYLLISDDNTLLKMLLSNDDSAIRENINTLKLTSVKFKKLPDNFYEGLSLCSFAMQRDDSDSKRFGSICFDNKILSTDNNRIGLFTLSSSFNNTFRLSVNAVDLLLRMREKPTLYAQSNNWLHFKTSDEIFFSCVELDPNDFPVSDYMSVIDRYSKNGSLYEFPEDFDKSINITSVLANLSRDKDIVIKKSKKNLVIIGECDYGEVSHKIKVKKDFIDLDKTIRINPNFLRDALKITRKFQIIDDIFKFESENFIYLLSTTID